MAYFPLCINLTGAQVLLLGEGKLMREKMKILLSFGANIRLFSQENSQWENHPCVYQEHRAFTEADLDPRPAMVVVADLPQEEKERISRLCQNRGIPVNVVDEPALCTFYFPALVNRGDLTVAVSSGGKSPGGTAWLRRHLEKHIPEQTEAILEWASLLRTRLRTEYPEADRKTILRQAMDLAFSKDRIPEEYEILSIIHNCTAKQLKDSPGFY